ncbi:hypothetical protein AB0D12_39090 [Streptomyces sp. NPDC048479]|uniref:hypothetical protein n=1 Tax=Streptomyces sp. NPDC048479 TaxID=3154725 RepID=UPI00341DD9D6
MTRDYRAVTTAAQLPCASHLERHHAINGRKRHIVVDTLGLPVMITVTPGDTRDEIMAKDLL